MSGPQSFYLPSSVTPTQLISDLSQEFLVSTPKTMTRRLTFIDTFDWRLYHKSLVAYCRDDALCLRKLNSHQIIHQQAGLPAPKFAADLPPGPLKLLLAPVIEMRALLPRASVQVQTEVFAILNRDQKTVVRLAFEKLFRPEQPNDNGSWPQLWLLPVRGYPGPAEKLAAALPDLGLEAVEQPDMLLLALEQAGQTPGDYSTRLDVQLPSAARSDEAAKAILGHVLPVIRQNEAGIKQDIDTEFLHDFRVAIRRTRAVLSQLKGVLPADASDRFRREFGDIARTTNDLRDLDVYLLDAAHYRAMLPEMLREDITPLFDYLREKRAAALARVVDLLNSETYAQTLHDWQVFLDQPGNEAAEAPHAGQPVIDLARRRLKKRYRRVTRFGRKILKNTQDEQLHALRIECKKLRYLLEFFASLFPADTIGALVKQLKKLQDNLGDFNDLCVQEAYLLHLADELPAADARSRHTLLAIGGLVATLDQKRAQVKSEFAKTFTGFASAENKKLFKSLLAAAPDGGTG
ncbi:MAG: hypothetical protein FOGNACKC_02529 [Anaerolineae bacterium]|nr:hypothetical protein [Anaerolineae bacterium]